MNHYQISIVTKVSCSIHTTGNSSFLYTAVRISRIFDLTHPTMLLNFNCSTVDLALLRRIFLFSCFFFKTHYMRFPHSQTILSYNANADSLLHYGTPTYRLLLHDHSANRGSSYVSFFSHPYYFPGFLSLSPSYTYFPCFVHFMFGFCCSVLHPYGYIWIPSFPFFIPVSP